MYRDPKTGRFVKEKTKGTVELPKAHRDPITGRFVSNKPAAPKKETDEVDKLKNRLEELEKKIERLETKLSKLGAADAIVPNYRKEVSEDEFLKPLPYPTWVIVKHCAEDLMNVHIDRKGYANGHDTYHFTSFARDGAFWTGGPISTVLIPANTSFNVTRHFKGEKPVTREFMRRYRCKGF